MPWKGRVYFLCLDTPLGSRQHSAQWYVGYAKDDRALEQRIKAHRAGRGSSFTRAAFERGIEIHFKGFIYGDREKERQIKREKGHSRVFSRFERQQVILCPLHLTTA